MSVTGPQHGWFPGQPPPQEWPSDRLKDYFERILKEHKETLAERELRINGRFDALEEKMSARFASGEKALKLQAEEYARRLKDLNGEYQRDRQRQAQYVSVDKWESTNEGERIARVAALLRVDEKFEEYVERYEVRQREVALLLAAQAGAADEAKRAVEEQGRKSDAQSRELARKQTRNLGLASLTLGLIVFGANVVPLLAK